jgi:aspartyl-tRNA(Asn)/glutamyl-tRNA(Gln) amidotransferase subunit A
VTDLTTLTLAEARDGLRAGAFSASELARAFLDAIAVANKALNAFVLPTPDHALKAARASERRLARGEARPLEGLPVAVKDLYCTKGVRTTACSKILDGFTPTYESTVTQNLWDCGAVMLGKVNNDEFAMGSSNETSCFGPAINPWRRTGSNLALVPGGSSGGSAVAVAADLCLAAIGTDTGGSIRQPASHTGTVGIKPTYGRCSRWGIVAYASSLDQAGPIAKTVRDAAILLRHMASADPKDSTSVAAPVPDYEAAVGGSIKGLRIGVPQQYRVAGMAQEIEELWQRGVDWLAAGGATISSVSLPHTKYALPAYYIVAPAECSSNLARYDGLRYGLQEAGGLWRGGTQAHSDGHLRAIGRLLRRLLHQGAEGAHADQARFRCGLRPGRCAVDADGPRAGVCRRRGGRRPRADVPERCLHGHRQHGGPARHIGAGRTLARRHPARAAADWQAVR